VYAKNGDGPSYENAALEEDYPLQDAVRLPFLGKFSEIRRALSRAALIGQLVLRTQYYNP